MSLHSRLASAELRCDLFAQQTGHDENHDFTRALRLVATRLREKVRANLERLHRHGNVTMRGDEDDFDRWIGIAKLALRRYFAI